MPDGKLSPLALGLTLAVLSSLSVLVAGLTSYYYSHGQAVAASYGTLYFGYKPSLSATLFGSGFAFINAFLCGFIVAWIYNLIVDHQWDKNIAQRTRSHWNKLTKKAS